MFNKSRSVDNKRLNLFVKIFELREISLKTGAENFSLVKLAAILLNHRVSKSQQLSNWDR